jgi:hypothetical protein
MAAGDRNDRLTTGLPLDRPGLEIAPLYRPTVTKDRGRVFYLDVCPAEESRAKHAGYEHDEIVDIDVVWTPGRALIDCVPEGRRFAWAIASHALEHVPDPIGWLVEVLGCMETGAVLSLALPDARRCMDAFRPETTVAQLIESWIRRDRVPSARQIYDFLSLGVSDGWEGHDGRSERALEVSDCTRHYSKQQALDFVFHVWTTGSYLDIHCSVFSPLTFRETIEELVELGLLDVAVSKPISVGDEFFVCLVKLGEPRVTPPVAFGERSADPIPPAVTHPPRRRSPLSLLRRSAR